MICSKKHLKPGEYVLGFRWDCETSAQVWQSCAGKSIWLLSKNVWALASSLNDVNVSHMLNFVFRHIYKDSSYHNSAKCSETLGEMRKIWLFDNK